MTFDPIALEERLARLPPRHRAAFAAACAQRQLENYEAFHRDTRWGEPQVLADALALLWNALEHPGTVDRARLRELAERAATLAPDPQRVPSEWAIRAIDAAAAVAYALESYLDADAEQVAWAAQGAYQAVYAYLKLWEVGGSRGDPGRDERILAHPWMREETERQEADLRMLEEVGTRPLDPDLLALLRERSQAAGLRPIRRGLQLRRSSTLTVSDEDGGSG